VDQDATPESDHVKMLAVRFQKPGFAFHAPLDEGKGNEIEVSIDASRRL